MNGGRPVEATCTIPFLLFVLRWVVVVPTMMLGAKRRKELIAARSRLALSCAFALLSSPLTTNLLLATYTLIRWWYSPVSLSKVEVAVVRLNSISVHDFTHSSSWCDAIHPSTKK